VYYGFKKDLKLGNFSWKLGLETNEEAKIVEKLT